MTEITMVALMVTMVVVILSTVMVVVVILRKSNGTRDTSGGSQPIPIPNTSSFSSFDDSTPASCWKYDVFLSFRGKDTRKTFVDHLYSALVERLTCTYKDDETLQRGDAIGPSLLKAIEESQIAVIIFSKNYADSSWCLDELAYIMKCRDERGLSVIPIFYDVEPTEVRKQKGEFGKAFAKVQNTTKDKVELWRKALVDASNIAGWEPKLVANGREAKCIKDIVATILDKLLSLNSVVDENLVGMGTRLHDIKSQLEIGSGGVRMVGIWGVGGGGKTTLASSVFTEISGKFDSCCFVDNIRVESSKHNLKYLQEKILSDILKTKVQVSSVGIGKNMIKMRLSRRNVLIVLDDVDDRKQLEALAGSHDWFGNGSRIIVTTRDEHLLRTHRVDVVSTVSLLSKDEDIRLFNKHAYNEENPIKDYKMLSKRVVSYAGGLPLALKVLGSFLYDKDNAEWVSTLDRLKDNPNMEIVEILKISYDGLEPLEKELFLDIACFFRRWNPPWMGKDEAMVILDACGYHPVIGVKVLIQKSLITVSENRWFDMHDLVEEMGHHIVRGEHPNNPEKHSRLWRQKEIEDMCSKSPIMDNNQIEAIQYFGSALHIPKLVSHMKKLRLLYVWCDMEGDSVDGPNFLSNELLYIYWYNFPASRFPESLNPSKLVILRLYNSLQEELWKDDKDLPCLKELKLSFMYFLVRTPDFGGLPCLQKLTLEYCGNLEEIHSSLGNHNSLVYIYVENCYKLRKFPNIVHMKKLEILGISNCMKLYEFPKIEANMDSLKFLHLVYVGIQVLPSSLIEYCRNLISLKLIGCKYLRSIDFSLSQLTQLILLNLSYCKNLVELPELPSTISILIADHCNSLEVVGDFHRNCKWLCQVSLVSETRVIGGDKLLQTMLQGKTIENHRAMSLQLKDYNHEIAKGFRPPLGVGSICRLQLPGNWYNQFSGFLICAVLIRKSRKFEFLKITMKHKQVGLTGMDSQQDMFWEDNYVNDEITWFWDEANINSNVSKREYTWVGYVPFGSLRHTTWWDEIELYNTIEFSIDSGVKKIDGFGVTLIPKKNQIETATTNSFSESSNDYTCKFKIKRDSKSALECEFTFVPELYLNLNRWLTFSK